MYTNAEFNGVGRACGAVHVVYYVVIARSRSTYSCNAPSFTLYRGPLTRRSSMAELGAAKEVGGIVVKAITVAYDLYKTYRDRQDSRGRFAKCAAAKHLCTPTLTKCCVPGYACLSYMLCDCASELVETFGPGAWVLGLEQPCPRSRPRPHTSVTYDF